MQLERHFADQMGALLGPDFPNGIAVAVSGGGDSMVMLHLAAGWARRFGVRLWPVTVDHGLRPDSKTEAALVAAEAAALGLSHQTLHWHWDGQGNLQDAARQARLGLIDGWRGSVTHVLMAHTQDDQAETVLMRLRRGSGVDGLAGMAPLRHLPGGMAVVRPLLDVRRGDLRHHAAVLRIPFVDDPSNEDDRFDRVRMRKMIAAEGWDVGVLAQTAAAMQRARAVLEDHADHIAQAILQAQPLRDGYAAFDRDALAATPAEIRLRLVARALMQVAAAPYRPRLSALEDAVERALSGGRATLHGCLIWAKGPQVWICREYNAVKDLTVASDVLWDGRWLFDGPHAPGYELRALGADGLATLPDWRATGLPRDVLLSAPGIWQADRLLAAPLAGNSAGWTARIVPDASKAAVPH